MAVPILGKRRERRDAATAAAIEAAVGKALSPSIAHAATVQSGATYGINTSDPFTQSGGYGQSYQGLPRTADDFGSLFGPGSPLNPAPLDAIGSSGRTPPRRYQYRVTENVNLLDREVPWTMLRDIASKVDVVSRCLELVQDAVGGMEWSFGFSQQIINQIRLENNEPNSAKATAIAREKYGDELTRVQKFWERPDERMGYTFTQWMALATWAQQVYDGIAVFPSYTLGGDLHSLSLLDTSTIKILLDNQGFIPQPPAPAYQQVLFGFPRGEFQAEDTDSLGNIPNAYMNDQLAYYVRRPRLHTVYGFSVVEECINYATMYQERQEWMHAEWSSGSTPKGVIETTGTDGWTPEQFAYFQQATNDQWSGQTQRRQQVMVMRPGMKWTQLKDFAELYNSQLDEWLVMQIGAKFGVPQQQLGIPMRSYLHSGAQNETSMDLTDKFALNSLVNFMIDCINDLTRRFMGVGPEITITATSGNSDNSDYQRAQADASDVNNGIRTRNEVRAERGTPLISDPEADALSVTAGNAVIFLPGQLAYQERSEQAIEDGQTAGATPNVSTPNDHAETTALPPGANPNAQPAPKSKSKTAETTNRAVGHISTTANSTNIPKQPNGPAANDSATGSYHEKELSAFLKFAKSRVNKSTYRDFEFQHVDERTATLLNDAVRFGDMDQVRSVISAIKSTDPIAAGLCVMAQSSLRVLMLQRALDDTDPNAGDWEFPGGTIETGETPYDAACREWMEETGCELPDGDCTNEWTSPNGIYTLYTYTIESEDEVGINPAPSARAILSADDPDNDGTETVAWWSIEDLAGNPALRSEVALVPFQDIAC